MGYGRRILSGSGKDGNGFGAALCLPKNWILDDMFNRYTLDLKNGTAPNRQHTIVLAFWAIRS
jgi:hypothetical protein